MHRSLIKKVLRLGGVDVKRYNKEFDQYAALYEKYNTYTMIPQEYFALNLELCSNFKSVQGDYVECGVWRGGMSAGIAEVLGNERRIHLFDSFEGLPPAKEVDGTAAIAWQQNITSPGYYDNCSAEESYAHAAMKLAGHQQYKTYRGWFESTLPSYDKRPIGILRLDGDWYDSIKTCMENLFPYVVPGGIIILDDYYTWDGCARAVHDYFSATHTPSRIYQWRNTIGYIIKKN
jgi:O-methyltransferase